TTWWSSRMDRSGLPTRPLVCSAITKATRPSLRSTPMSTGSMVRPERPPSLPKACCPNGLCFSPDEKILYIVESRGVPNRKILAYDVSPGGDTISNKRVFIDAGPGTPDGFRCDIDGNLWCGWGMGDPELDGVVVFAPDGVMIG